MVRNPCPHKQTVPRLNYSWSDKEGLTACPPLRTMHARGISYQRGSIPGSFPTPSATWRSRITWPHPKMRPCGVSAGQGGLSHTATSDQVDDPEQHGGTDQ